MNRTPEDIEISKCILFGGGGAGGGLGGGGGAGSVLRSAEDLIITIRQRDTYRDLCGELVAILKATETHIDELFKTGKDVGRGMTPTTIRNIHTCITKAEKILGAS